MRPRAAKAGRLVSVLNPMLKPSAFIDLLWSRCVSERVELSQQPIQVPVQLRPVHRTHHADDQVHCRQFVLCFSEPVPDDPLDPISGTGPCHCFLAYDQAQSGVLHSIENDVQT
jgi:hypothetical protein